MWNYRVALLQLTNTFYYATWKFDGDFKSDIVLYLKWLTGPQKIVIMIRCNINFNILVKIRLIIWYLELHFYEFCHSCFKWKWLNLIKLGQMEFCWVTYLQRKYMHFKILILKYFPYHGASMCWSISVILFMLLQMNIFLNTRKNGVD